MTTFTRRQVLSTATKIAAVAAASRLYVVEGYAQAASNPAPPKYAEAFAKLDAFIADYMKLQDAPGMTLALASRSGIVRTAAYGLADLKTRAAVDPAQLFEIGSISKSFCAIAMLHAVEAGKLDLQKPITDYVPWFQAEMPHGVVTTHDLLMHGSGLDSGNVFPADTRDKHVQAYKPGAHFHYSNMAFDLMAHIFEAAMGSSYHDHLREKIFAPLGMIHSHPSVSPELRDSMPESYWPRRIEVPYVAGERLAEASIVMFDGAAGCVSSNAEDMARYMQALLTGGDMPSGRLLSRESYQRMMTPHIAAEEFGPGAQYGYGIAIDKLDGHKIARHTGGMTSYMSSIWMDLDGGVGAFASINAQQGYRPNPVAKYAIQLMRAVDEGKPLPAAPALPPADQFKDAADYAGVYVPVDAGDNAEPVEFVAEGDKLYLQERGRRFPAVNSPGGVVVRTRAWRQFGFFFERAGKAAPSASPAAPPPDAAAPAQTSPNASVAAAKPTAKSEPYSGFGWGSRYFTRKGVAAPVIKGTRLPEKELRQYVGFYSSNDPWTGSTRVVLRRGELWLDGSVRLEPISGSRFAVKDEEFSPEWAEFRTIVNGRARLLMMSGSPLWRVDAES